MKKLILILPLLAGCARFQSVQEHSLADGTKETTKVSIWTFFDAHNEVSKLRTTATDKSQGISLGSVSENASSSNVVEIIRIGGATVQKLP